MPDVDGHKLDDILHAEVAEKPKKAPVFYDPLTGAHFDYLDLFEKLYELKRYRRKVDRILGVVGSESLSEGSGKGRVTRKQMRRQDQVFVLGEDA